MLYSYFMSFAALSICWSNTGDNDHYLDALINAQRANEGRYTHGELRAKFRTKQLGKPTIYNYAEIHTIWSGGRSWSNVKRWRDHNHEVDPQTDGHHDHLEWIVDTNKLVTYNPGSKMVNISPIARTSPPFEAKMTPSACWYGPLGTVGSGVTWRWILEQNTAPGYDASKFHFAINKKSGDLVEVQRHEDQYGGNVRMIFSMSQDGNVVEFEIKEPASNHLSKGTFDWRKDGQGKLYLNKSDYYELVNVEGDKIEKAQTYEITSFDSEYRAEAKRFELESLKLPNGTVIFDELTGRNRRIGDASIEDVTSRLDPLIETVRSRGFASDRQR